MQTPGQLSLGEVGGDAQFAEFAAKGRHLVGLSEQKTLVDLTWCTI